MDIATFQQQMVDLYGDRDAERGLARTFAWSVVLSSLSGPASRIALHSRRAPSKSSASRQSWARELRESQLRARSCNTTRTPEAV